MLSILKTTLAVFAIITVLAVGMIFFATQKTAPADENEENNIVSQIAAKKKTSATKNNSQSSINNSTSTSPTEDSVIKTFEQCVAAGKKVTGAKPRRTCQVNDKLQYLEIELCAAPTGESLNIYDAQRVFDMSQCSREGSAKDTHYCDTKAGAWVIDIQTYRKGCNPACIIDVKTKTGKVDWRCAATTPQQ
jgi:hypothetical protein